MILTCPECATSYFVDDGKIPPAGRSVRCANCGARWTATAESELELTASPEAVAAAEDPHPQAVNIDELSGEALPKVFRARADNVRKVRQAATFGVVWAAAAAALAILAALAIVFRADVVRHWPRSAAAYATIGMPVNSLGLVLDAIKAEPALEGGHAVLAISGQIRNIMDREAMSPPLKISLLDKSGKSVATHSARAADPRIPPGQTRHFAISVIDPPTDAHDLEVTFAAMPMQAKAKAGRHNPPPQAAAAHPPPAMKSAMAHQATLDGPARPSQHPPPVDARPLPPDSPYALPQR